MQREYCCRVAPSLGGGFAGTPQEVWGTKEYDPKTDIDKPTVFFGLYGLPDFYALWRHRGEKYVLWAGSDIRHFVNGYWLDDRGLIKIDPEPYAEWISKNCESYVENELERKLLWNYVQSDIVPSFLGDVNKYQVSFTPGNHVYTSVSGDEFELYGIDDLGDIALESPDIVFHLYGTSEDATSEMKRVQAFPDNVILHGRVSQEEMDEQTSQMQGALRLTKVDGFSEILAKSVLWGQHPISPYIKYDFMLSGVKDILKQDKPNIEGRYYYKGIINKYPWNTLNTGNKEK